MKDETEKLNKKKEAWTTPIVSQIELNPEQAVLACDCYGKFASGSRQASS